MPSHPQTVIYMIRENRYEFIVTFLLFYPSGFESHCFLFICDLSLMGFHLWTIYTYTLTFEMFDCLRWWVAVVRLLMQCASGCCTPLHRVHSTAERVRVCVYGNNCFICIGNVMCIRISMIYSGFCWSDRNEKHRTTTHSTEHRSNSGERWLHYVPFC